MARTRWPPGPVNPGLLPGQADQTGSAGGCHNLGPGRQIVSKDSPSAASADSEVRPGPRPPTLRPNRDTTREAGPEALPTSSLPILCACSGDGLIPAYAADSPVRARGRKHLWARGCGGQARQPQLAAVGQFPAMRIAAYQSSNRGRQRRRTGAHARTAYTAPARRHRASPTRLRHQTPTCGTARRSWFGDHAPCDRAKGPVVHRRTAADGVAVHRSYRGLAGARFTGSRRPPLVVSHPRAGQEAGRRGGGPSAPAVRCGFRAPARSRRGPPGETTVSQLCPRAGSRSSSRSRAPPCRSAAPCPGRPRERWSGLISRRSFPRSVSHRSTMRFKGAVSR